MIYCVEDDTNIREIEMYALAQAGFEAIGLSDGDLFLRELQNGVRPELVLLDIMLPGASGISILRHMRRQPDLQRIPIIMATAKGEEYDRVIGLDLGADDYLVKPFSMLEMVSRIRAVLRRCSPESEPQEVLRNGRIVLDAASRIVTCSGEEIALTYKEFELLRLFMVHPGRAYTRDQLFDSVWGTDFVGETRTLDTHIRSLRRKLGIEGNLIETVRNVGYRMRRDS